MGKELMSELQKEYLAEIIFELGGWRFDEKGIRFSFHDKHPYLPLALDYVDLRALLRKSFMRSVVAGALMPLIDMFKPDLLCDLPLAASPLVATLSDMTNIPMITIRHEALKGGSKKYGVGGAILGAYRPGNTVMIIDDILSALAHTKFEAINILRDAELIPSPAILVAVDREEGGREALGRELFRVYDLLSLSFMRSFYLAKHLTTKERYDKAEEASRALKEAASELADRMWLQRRINEILSKWGLSCEIPEGLRSVGIGGDCRTYTLVVFLRGPFPGDDVLAKVSSEITNRFPINRVLFEISKKS